jgi:hypothetical protein
MPAEMAAIAGRTASSSAGVVDECDPWWPTFSSSTGASMPREASAASTGASASPVRSASNPPVDTSSTTEPLLISPSGSGADASAAVG